MSTPINELELLEQALEERIAENEKTLEQLDLAERVSEELYELVVSV